MKKLETIECLYPQSLHEALQELAAHKSKAKLIAGGTDLVVQWQTGGLPLPERAICVSALPELTKIEESNDDIVIGASVTHSSIKHSPAVKQYLPALRMAAATVGATQIQCLGTIGGNVANASPAGDLAPALLVTSGSVTVASAHGERVVPLNSFFKGYRKLDLKEDEIIVSFHLPKKQKECTESFRKLGPRKAQAISKVMAAYRGTVQDRKIKHFAVALGSVAPTAVRLPKLEEWLKGQKLTKALLDEAEKRASEEVSPIDDIRSTANYRKWVSGRLVRFFLEELMGE